MAQVFRVVKALDDVINNLKTQVSLRPVKVVAVNTKEIWGPKLKSLPLIFLMKRHIQYSKRRDSLSYKIRILRAVPIKLPTFRWVVVPSSSGLKKIHAWITVQALRMFGKPALRTTNFK
jgi:hypothetical protein